MSRRLTVVALFCGLMIAGAIGALAQTADEILDEVQSLFSVDEGDAQQGVLATMTIHNDYSGGVSSEYTLAVFEYTLMDPAQPENADETTYALMYFMGGDEEGSIFLLKTPEDDAVDSQMWLYLPALGITKELVSDEEQSGSFAGSSMSYGDLGGTTDLRENYSATILREETVTVGDETFAAWVLELIAKPDADADYARVVLWVTKEDYLTVRMESYDDSGVLESTMEFQALGEFEGDRIPEVIRSMNVEDETSSTITIVGTRRPDAPLTLDLFDPRTLGELDPSLYGF